jgi:hypothetical protein
MTNLSLCEHLIVPVSVPFGPGSVPFGPGSVPLFEKGKQLFLVFVHFNYHLVWW